MIKPKAGILVFSESLVREDVYKKRKPIAQRETQKFVKSVSEDIDIVWPTIREIRSKKQAVKAIAELQGSAVDAVILYVPIFIAPALVAHTANLLTVPMVLASNEAGDSLSQLAFLAVGGAIDQIGLSYMRVPGDSSEEPQRTAMIQFLRAAAAKQQLKGQTFGCIGGRALGISTGTADVALWQRIFGVDIEHIDQFEIVRQAEKIDRADVEKYAAWLKEKTGVLEFNDSNFTPQHLDRQIRSYLATKQIIEHFELDFLGIKCQPEMSNGYCLQCLNVAFCNDPYDADGPKEPKVCSCEADADGALTMQILKILSGGKPTNLNDIAWMSDTEMTLANCGSMATYFAGLCDLPAENLKSLSILPHVFGDAGGAATVFTVPAGKKMTLARLFRKADKYCLGVLTGNTVHKDRKAQSDTILTRPLIFIDMNIDKKFFLETFGSNHILGVEGDLKAELAEFAGLLGIKYYDYDLTVTS